MGRTLPAGTSAGVAGTLKRLGLTLLRNALVGWQGEELQGSKTPLRCVEPVISRRCTSGPVWRLGRRLRYSHFPRTGSIDGLRSEELMECYDASGLNVVVPAKLEEPRNDRRTPGSMNANAG